MSRHRVPWLVRTVRQVEGATPLDPAVGQLNKVAQKLVANPSLRDLLHGRWLGHAVHPLLTDLPLGLWASASLLDVVGPETAHSSSQRLIGIGVLAAIPTAVTGIAEWAVIGRPEQRVGVVHAAANGAALGCYAASYLARRRGHHRAGMILGLAGGGAAAVAGYLGGHLAAARHVGSRHPAFTGR